MKFAVRRTRALLSSRSPYRQILVARLKAFPFWSAVLSLVGLALLLGIGSVVTKATDSVPLGIMSGCMICLFVVSIWSSLTSGQR